MVCPERTMIIIITVGILFFTSTTTTDAFVKSLHAGRATGSNQRRTVAEGRNPYSFMEALPTTSSEIEHSVRNPWYSDSTIERDRSHVMQSPADAIKVASSTTSKFVLIESKRGMHYKANRLETDGASATAVEPLYLTFAQAEDLIGKDCMNGAVCGKSDYVVAWVGQYNGEDYWVLYLPEELPESAVAECIAGTTTPDGASLASVLAASPLREFGDSLESAPDAAILASCNGLIEFHKSHPFCSRCGSRTAPTKAGASRRCINPDCKASVYPRIDVASIMLITSACGEYALLGRKRFWPQGRYSTLSGFAEVGETLEQCCTREVMEESGVRVDLDSIEFVLSQPWPFPRSLMAGFRGKAIDQEMPGELPPIYVDENEMDDIQWFRRDFVRERLGGGSTALGYEPNEQESEFHIPGKSSLARVLISQWANQDVIK